MTFLSCPEELLSLSFHRIKKLVLTLRKNIFIITFFALILKNFIMKSILSYAEYKIKVCYLLKAVI